MAHVDDFVKRMVSAIHVDQALRWYKQTIAHSPDWDVLRKQRRPTAIARTMAAFPDGMVEEMKKRLAFEHATRVLEHIKAGAVRCHGPRQCQFCLCLTVSVIALTVRYHVAAWCPAAGADVLGTRQRHRHKRGSA